MAEDFSSATPFVFRVTIFGYRTACAKRAHLGILGCQPGARGAIGVTRTLRDWHDLCAYTVTGGYTVILGAFIREKANHAT